jgi:glycine/D-amino acid oxidase-like deaminating enzyme
MAEPARGTDYRRAPYWHAAWTPSADPATAATAASQPLPASVDVCVVGAGYTGMVAALALARKGASVLVVDANGPGWGASTRNGGIFHPGLKFGRAALEHRFGSELGGRVFRAGLDAFFTAERFVLDNGFDVGYRRAGLAVLAWSPSHLRDLATEGNELTDAGMSARMVEGEALREEAGTDYYPGALVIEESGLIHPARYYAAVLAAAREAGVTVVGGTRVTSVEAHDRPRTVVTPRGRVQARDVLIATNGYTDGAMPWLQQRVMPIGSYIIATEPMSPELATSISPRGRAFFDSKSFLYYWHVNDERRLVFGGRASFAQTSVDRTAAILQRALALVHPQAADLRIDFAWGGKVGFTFDRLPHLGEHDGIHYALGYCGSGLALGTTFGLTIAERIGAGTETGRHTSPFEEIPFGGAPFAPWIYRGKPWFLPLAGEWFRLADRWARRGVRVPATAATSSKAAA